MFLKRCVSWTVLLALGLAFPLPLARGQQKLDDIKLTPKLDTEVNEMKKGETEFKPSYRKTLDDFMAYFSDKLQHQEMFSAAKEFATPILPMENMLNQFASRVLIPVPGQRFTIHQADYIKAYGDSFVKTFKPTIESQPVSPIVRLNAARLMAVGAASGAPAFAPLITDLLANANTPAEVKYYAFKAAEALLAAYDIQKLAGSTPLDHTLKTTDLIALVKVLEANIFDPTKFVPFPQGVDPKQPSAELGAVVSFIRRQAIRALARVRIAVIDDGANGTIQPAYTLARIAMSDPAITPAPGPMDVAEAAIGLCGMQPGNTLMMDAAADAVATGILTFASTLNNPNLDSQVKTTPWKIFASRLRAALAGWKTLVANSSVPANRSPQSVNAIAEAADAVLIPLEQSGAAGRTSMNLQKLIAARQEIRKSPGYSGLLIRGDGNSSLARFQK